MGIENLLNFVKPALTERCIAYYQGKTAAVDAMSWLYRGCYSCAYELNQNIKTNDYLYFLQKMLMMLREYQVTPILVFDGRKLRAKEKTEQIRKQLKAQNLEKGKELLTNGNQVEAKKYLQRCLKITKQMLYTTFDVLKEMEVQFIIAPYEADAQLAYMCQSGQCDFAITEDSDLICYRCPVIVFKLLNDGSCFELELAKLRENKQNRSHIKNDDLRQFLAFTDEQLIDSCIMSGCDYVPSVRGIGIVKAINLINKYDDIGRVISKMKQNKQYQEKIPSEYERVIRSTRLIFLYQTIYCSFSQKWKQLNQEKYELFMQNIENEKLIPVNQIQQLLGEKIQEDLQQQFSNGWLDLKTLKPREIMKIDFVQLFKRFDRRIQNSQQIVVDIEVKQKVQNFLETTDLDNLPEFLEKPALAVRDQQFLPTKKKQQQNEDIDIFQICEDLFDQQNQQNLEINVDELEVIQDDQENEVEIQEILQTQKKQQQQSGDEDSASEQFNPFAHRSIVKNTQSLSQIQSKDLEQQTQKKKTIEKVLKQSQSTMYSFVKKQ